MSFSLNGLSQTDQFQAPIQEAAEQLKKLVWMIIIIALIAFLWMAFTATR